MIMNNKINEKYIEDKSIDYTGAYIHIPFIDSSKKMK